MERAIKAQVGTCLVSREDFRPVAKCHQLAILGCSRSLHRCGTSLDPIEWVPSYGSL